LLFWAGLAAFPADSSPSLLLPTRSRVKTADGRDEWQRVEKTVAWNPKKTAIVICDMWDKHWCEGATRRVAEMAPRINAVVQKARSQGVFIIHCPSDTMKFYEGTPGRKLAQAAPPATPKVPLQRWCSLDQTRETSLPIDDADGGCDEFPQCKTYTAWKKQIATIEISEGDAITDSAEAYYLMQQRGIDHVIVMGVHLNMCVLGRPFSIRQMVNQGKNVLLMRDLTDTMYNSRRRPYVPHCVGTELMIEHVEKFWCPTITSAAFLAGGEFRFSEDRRPQVVFLIGEDEYKTWETLPRFARQALEWRGLRVSIVQESKADKNNFPGLVEALREADLLLVSVRRRGLPKEQLDAVRAHLAAGKPLVGIRTACHAFAPRGQETGGGGSAWWPTFDPEVFGGNYTGHHDAGPQTSIRAVPGEEKHPILAGVNLAQLVGHGSLYTVSPLKKTVRPLLVGSIPNQPPEPITWTHSFGAKEARIFYTSLGHPDDFANPSFQRLLLNGILWALGQPIPPAEAKADQASRPSRQPEPAGESERPPKEATPRADAGQTGSVSDPRWRRLAVPGAWEETAPLDHDRIGWYRCWVKVPATWAAKEMTLAVENIENAHEAFVNGAKIGGAGRFPPNYQNGIEFANRYVVPPEKVRPGAWNLIAIRVCAHEGPGGFRGAPPQLGTDKQHLSLAGSWQFRQGDDLAWAHVPAPPGDQKNRAPRAANSGGSSNASSQEKLLPAPATVGQGEGEPGLSSFAAFSKVEEGAVPRGSSGHPMANRGNPLEPAESARSFTVPQDLEIEQVLSEPIVRQPLFLNFDERGRMWVVQYIQYPAPAGLKVVSKDVFWRAVYDKVPQPPPRGARGLDKITIHEDTDGDGIFDKHKTFVDGLNIATACVKGRGGLWVLNPPYLLFYPDANDDDVPDGPPVVHLEGFGLEDTHSVVNSLRWGPDGWLYAAQGSTVTGNVRRPAETNFVHTQGQNIWRYHPGTHRYEVFAEGGGNAFGVEIDAQGRLFSGHNGGDTRGFHYLQGAYLRKGFEKHGELSNPYAFGYFPQMGGTKGERFTHNFILYHGGALPDRYEGKLFGVEPLQGRVVLSEILPDGSTFQTRDLERVVTSSDSWFRPVDIKVGPDGAIYLCDWYDRQVTHTRNQEGNIDTSNGRIYRLKAKGAKPLSPFNLAQLRDEQLVSLLEHTNAWFRQTALRLLADRAAAPGGSAELASRPIVPHLVKLVSESQGQLSLEALWALHLSGGLTDEVARKTLHHSNPQVRLWTVRLLGDEAPVQANRVSPDLARELAPLARGEPDVEVRAQLACTARRLPAKTALPILANLLHHDEDARDPRLPLLGWWALESKCEGDRDAVLRLFEESSFWTQPLVQQHLLERTMRRFAAAGTRQDLLACARLLELSPAREQSVKLMGGFEEAFKGRSLAGLPDELIRAMARHDVGSPAFRLRQGKPEAVERALQAIRDPQADKHQQLQFIQILGEARQPAAVAPLLELLTRRADHDLRCATLTTLAAYDRAEIGTTVVELYHTLTGDVRTAAETLLASRTAWSLDLAEAVRAGRLKPSDVPLEVVRQMKLHKSEPLATLIARQWPETGRPTSAAMQQQIKRLAEVVRSGKGDPYRGQKLFNTTCASCHTLFARGGQVGPDLTSYQRQDLDAMLLNIVNPNAEVREGYESFFVETRDDRTLSGFLVERDHHVVVLRGVDGQNVTLNREEIAEMKAAGLSLMPEGLLDNLDEQQVRDLFAYLRSTQPLAN